MTVELLFGRSLMLLEDGIRPFKNGYYSFQCDRYSDIMPKISQVLEAAHKKRKLSFFRRHRLPHNLRHVYVKITDNYGHVESYRLGITRNRKAYYSYEVQTGNLFRFLYKIDNEAKKSY